MVSDLWPLKIEHFLPIHPLILEFRAGQMIVYPSSEYLELPTFDSYIFNTIPPFSVKCVCQKHWDFVMRKICF